MPRPRGKSPGPRGSAGCGTSEGACRSAGRESGRYMIVPYQAEMEREIVRLWEESRGPEGIEHRLTVFRWFTGRNPFLRGRPPYWCLQDGSRVVGMHGHMPVVFDVDGREQLGHLAQDDLLHPNARGKG